MHGGGSRWANAAKITTKNNFLFVTAFTRTNALERQRTKQHQTKTAIRATSINDQSTIKGTHSLYSYNKIYNNRFNKEK
jgi:hypothetical protein